MLIRVKVRPGALTRQRIIFVMTGISPKGSTDRPPMPVWRVFFQHRGKEGDWFDIIIRGEGTRDGT